jgi:hypothetical protein
VLLEEDVEFKAPPGLVQLYRGRRVVDAAV